MGRKAIDDLELRKTYNNIVCCLIQSNGKLSADELKAMLNISGGRLSKSLQYGRRNFPKNTKIDNLVLGSQDGYFIPENINELVAWYMQYYKFSKSLCKTIEGVRGYIYDKAPEMLEEANQILKYSDEDPEDPFGVMNTLL